MSPDSKNKAAQAIIFFLLGWVYLSNILLKQQGIAEAFFQIIDTISEDIVMGGGAGLIAATIFAVLICLGRFFVTFFTRRDFFVQLERILFLDSQGGRARRILLLDQEEVSTKIVPTSSVGITFSLGLTYIFGIVSVLLLSQPLLLFSPLSSEEIESIVLFTLIPMLSFRGLVLFGYSSHAQMAQSFVFLCIFLSLLFSLGVWGLDVIHAPIIPNDIGLQKSFVYYGILYAFIPTLLEGFAWLALLFSSGDEQ